MKGGLVLAVAAFRRIAQARRRTPLPITFLFTPDEELSSLAMTTTIALPKLRSRYAQFYHNEDSDDRFSSPRCSTWPGCSSDIANLLRANGSSLPP
jgi:Peptidase family M20/M25/M40